MRYTAITRAEVAFTVNAADVTVRNNELHNTPQIEHDREMQALLNAHHRFIAMLELCCDWRKRPAGYIPHKGLALARRDRTPPWISWDPRAALHGESSALTPGLDSCLFLGRKPRPVVLWRDPHRLIEMVRYIAMRWHLAKVYEDVIRIHLTCDLSRIHILGGNGAMAMTFSLPLLRLLRLNSNVKK